MNNINAGSWQSEADCGGKLTITLKINTSRETHRQRAECTTLKVTRGYVLIHDFLKLQLQLFQHPYSYNIELNQEMIIPYLNLVFIIIKAWLQLTISTVA